MTIRLFLSAMVIAVALTGGITCFARSRNNQPSGNAPKACVILLHGLCRSALSMKPIERFLKQEGYAVLNISYDSTRQSIPAITDGTLAPAVSKALDRGYQQIHFVTHSLGAIVVRSYLQTHQLPPGSRIVMLAPPNKGSELADWTLENFPHLSKLAGPSFRQLGTGPMTLIAQLAPINVETGIIIGNGSWNPLFSRILPGSDDGKVTVARARLQEMHDFRIVSCNHTTILLKQEVRQQITCFLKHGHFSIIESMLEQPNNHCNFTQDLFFCQNANTIDRQPVHNRNLNNKRVWRQCKEPLLYQ